MNRLKEKIAHAVLVLLAGFILTSCSDGKKSVASGQQPASATSSLVVAKVNAAASPVIAVVMDNTGKEKIGIIGTKNSSGTPISVTQGVYISASGEVGMITMGADGLPASLSDTVGNKTTFTNFTDNLMDITQFDPAGNTVAGPLTVNVDPTVLAKLRANAVTLASPITQGTSLVAGVFLGASTQEWVEIAADTTGIGFGLVGCVTIGRTVGSFLVDLKKAMCTSTLTDVKNTWSGTDSPTYITVADVTAGVGVDCFAEFKLSAFKLSACVSNVVRAIVKPIENALTPPPSVPTGLTLLKVQGNHVIFSWIGSSGSYAWITGYKVYRDGSQIADELITSYVDTKVIPGTRYCYTVAAHDANGQSSGVSDPLCVTIPSAALVVSSTTPVSGTSGALVSSAVFATFNETIDASTLNTSTFTVTGSGGLVTGTVSYNAVTQSAVFTPSANLAYAATYTATVTTGVKDLSGNPLVANYSWNFTTASNIGDGTTPLSFTVLNPASISTGAAGYQPTLTASGANFSNLTQIRFDWSGVASGSATWVKGTASWDPSKITVYSDSLMTLKPVVTSTSDPAGITNWTVTLTDTAGATAIKTFTVNYTPTGTITCTAPQVLTNGVCVTPPTNTSSISGSVGLSGVTMTLSGASSGGAMTDANGNYTFGNLANGSYTIAPALSGYSFTPASLVITVSGANITAANFTATSQAGTLYSIQGSTFTSSGAGLPGVTMTLSGANSGVYTTNVNGQYGFALLANGSYTITPALSGYTFIPASSVITISGANIMGTNFTGSASSTPPPILCTPPQVLTNGVCVTPTVPDTTKPIVSGFSVTPGFLTVGSPFTISYTISDAGGFGLWQAQLWRAPDAGGVPGTWVKIATNLLSGNGPVLGSFTDAPTTGTYWYGVHGVDTAVNIGVEPIPARIVVNSTAIGIPSTPTGTATSGVSATLSGPGPVTPSSTVNMSWNTSIGTGVDYNLIVTDVTNNVQALNIRLLGNTYTTALTAAHQYNWKVAACNATGCSPYTAAQYFQTPGAIAPTPTPSPTISFVSPNPAVATGVAQPFTINGSGFASGTTVTLHKSSGTVFPNRPISSLTASQIVINPNFGTIADTWSVEVISPSGVSSGRFTFTVRL